MKDDEKRFLVEVYNKCKMLYVNRVMPRHLINEDTFYMPRKRAFYLLEKWCNKGWYECGVTIDTGWLTPDGNEQAKKLMEGFKMERMYDGNGNTVLDPKDSGNIREFGTGAIRDNADGKGRCDLLPACALLRLARHYEAGAKKYGDRNWEKGQPISALMDSGMRHMLKYLDGWTDEDHLAAAAWNILGAMWMEEKRPEMQDIAPRINAAIGLLEKKEPSSISKDILRDLHSNLTTIRASMGDCEGTYTNGFRLGKLNGQIELLEGLLRVSKSVMEDRP